MAKVKKEKPLADAKPSKLFTFFCIFICTVTLLFVILHRSNEAITIKLKIMILTETIANRLLSYFCNSKNKDNAVERLTNLCKKYNCNLHFLDFDFSEWNIKEIDSTYTLILTF